MRVVAFHGFGGAYAVALKALGAELVGVVEPGGFGARVVEENRAFLEYEGPIFIGKYEDAPVYDEIDVVLGNPPCSAFSGLNSSPAARGRDAPVIQCMWELVRYAARTNRGQGATTVIFESVQEAGHAGRDLMRDLRLELESLTGQRYGLTHLFMSGASVGAAQVRKRYFWVASKLPFGVEPPVQEHVVTYEDAIGDLVGLEMTTDWQPVSRPRSAFAEGLAYITEGEGWVTDHVCGDERTAARFAAAGPWWRPGEDSHAAAKRCKAETGEWPPLWLDRDIDYVVNNRGFSRGHRVKANQPGYVISGSGGYSFLHYEEDRILSVREVARLMGFPDAMQFGYAHPNMAYKWLGKQVPVQSWHWSLWWVQQSLYGHPGWWGGAWDEENRESVVDCTHDWKQVLHPKTLEPGVDARSPVWVAKMAAREAAERLDGHPQI